MEIPSSRGILGMLLLWSLCYVTASSAQPLRGRLLGRGYLRAADVRRQCRSVLSSASELTITRSAASGLMSGLPDADWHQDAGDAPLMPLPVPDPGTLLEEATTQFATLSLTHVDTVMDGQGQRGRLALNVSGVLSLTIISRNGGGCCSAGSSKYDDSMDPHRRVSPEFKLHPGVSKLDILLEGVYTETKSSSGFYGDGERVLCMVGDALLPVRGSNSTAGPWDWAKNSVGDSSSFEPPVMADGNIVFTLRFPKWQTMTTRAMLGELMSTSAKSDKAYFDTVRLVSHGKHFSSDGYQFRPREELTAAVASGCSTRPFFCDDDDVSASNNCAGDLSEDVPICDILRAGEYGVLAVVPNWKCDSNSTDDDEEFCSRLGPFVDTGAGQAVNTTGRAFTDFAIAVQAIRCTGLDADGTAQVSAVFRAVPPWEDQLTAVRRTGLSGMTLSAEGVWSASTRRLCMVACLGTGDKACQHRVSLFFPTTFSLTRRGIVVGQIASMDGSYFPLSFQRALDPGQMWNKASRPDESLRMAYDYKKIDQAMELLIRSSKRSRLSSSLVAMSLISYPSPTKRAGSGTADDDDATGILAEDLGLNFRVVGPKPHQGFLPEWIKGQFFQLQILSIGPLVRSKVHYRFDEGFQLQSSGRSGMQLRGVQNGMDHNGGVEVQQQILNVSAAFKVSSRSSSGWHRPMISLEGFYDPSDGRMHLIGCRDVEAPWRVLSKTRGLESGMDCSMEVKVEYPPTTMRWLFSPAAKVYISSTRAADDPLHFDRAELKAMATSYPSERYSSNAFLTENAEGILCVAILSASVAASLAQLRHIKSHPDVAPYVSLAMLGAQALGHGATLVTDARMLPAWAWPPPTRYSYYRDDYSRQLLRWPDMERSVKALALAALLLTLRLAHKVRRARARARARAPLEPGRVPGGDSAVLLCSLGVHLGGLLFVLAVPWLTAYGTSKATLYGAAQARQQGTSATSLVACTIRAERYVALVLKDWFLLPQVIGNALWRVNCKPLTKGYYAGVTGMWLLPRVYGFLGPAVNNMYYYSHLDGAQDDAMDFYAKVSAVLVPLVAAALAVSVYVQQRWNYRILGWAMGSSKQKKLQHVY